MKELLDMNRIPEHIAIIMDGNGRWATERGLDRTFGHKAGLDTVTKITAECSRLGVKYLTLYTFSTENWGRPEQEIQGLWTLLLEYLNKETPYMLENDIKFRVVGDLERLPEYLPFDETIFIDSDCLAYKDLNDFWEVFKDADDFSMFGTNFPVDYEYGWFQLGKAISVHKHLVAHGSMGLC